MRKYLVIVSLVIGFVSLGLLFGCAQTTETTTTTTCTATTTTTAATTTTTTTSTTSTTGVSLSASHAVIIAKTGALLANGGASSGTSASSIGSSTGKEVKVSSVKAMSGDQGPPESFFTVNLTDSTDGWLSVTDEAFGGNMIPYMRLKTQGGQGAWGSYLLGKKIAILGTCEVRTIFMGTPGTEPPGISAGVQNFATQYSTIKDQGGNPYASSSLFKPVSTEADYLAWAIVWPTIEAGCSQQQGWPSGANLTTPEASANDKIGSTEMKMVFQKTATGEVIIILDSEEGGKPTPGTYSGTGKLVTSQVGTMDSTVSMTHGADGPPTLVTVNATTEATPKYNVRVYMYPSTMTATGEIYKLNGSWNLIGTLEASQSGGKVYIEGTSGTFFF